MHVSPSGVVNAYAESPSTANSDGFTGAYALTLGGGGGGGRLGRVGRGDARHGEPGRCRDAQARRSLCSALAQLRCRRSEQQSFYPNV